jgi:K+-transporting ATPase KdpF subunit
VPQPARGEAGGAARIENCCDMETVLAGLIALVLGGYLFVALVSPEKF